MAVTRAVQNLRRTYEEYMGGMEEEPSEEEKRRAVRGFYACMDACVRARMMTCLPEMGESD